MPIDKFKKETNVFVETGSYLGNGIQRAITAGFKKVISIEIQEDKYKFCSQRFKQDKKVSLYFGASEDLLKGIIDEIKEPITFWLDGHFSEGDRIKGVKMKTLCPLIEELDVIKSHPIKSHIILIDDVNCWKGMDNIYHEGFDIDSLIKKLQEINPDYEIGYINGMQEDGTVMENDILIAKPKTK